MKQAELDRAVARATNETVTVIKRLGFSLVDPQDVALELEEDHFLDWDVTQAARHQESSWRPHYEPAAA